MPSKKALASRQRENDQDQKRNLARSLAEARLPQKATGLMESVPFRGTSKGPRSTNLRQEATSMNMRTCKGMALQATYSLTPRRERVPPSPPPPWPPRTPGPLRKPRGQGNPCCRACPVRQVPATAENPPILVQVSKDISTNKGTETKDATEKQGGPGIHAWTTMLTEGATHEQPPRP